MKYTTAACGHLVPAIGSPGSAARAVCEAGPCKDCDTPEYWQREYDLAPEIPLSQEEKDAIVKFVLEHP